jgi:hypothetical protein
MLEKDFQQWVVDLARWHGWLVHHTRTVKIAGGGWTSPGLDAGFPDLVLARPDELIFAELKTNTGKTTGTQARWLDVLDTAPIEVVVWRPKDMPHIMERLAPICTHVRRSRVV